MEEVIGHLANNIALHKKLRESPLRSASGDVLIEQSQLLEKTDQAADFLTPSSLRARRASWRQLGLLDILPQKSKKPRLPGLGFLVFSTQSIF